MLTVRLAPYWLPVVVVTAYGCIGTTEASPTDSYASGDARAYSNTNPRREPKASCEPPELTTGDLDTARSAPCSVGDLGRRQVTEEPPEIHP